MLGLAFKAAPIVTILGGLLLAFVVGVALFVHLDRGDPPLGRGRVAFLVVMIIELDPVSRTPADYDVMA